MANAALQSKPKDVSIDRYLVCAETDAEIAGEAYFFAADIPTMRIGQHEQDISMLRAIAS